MLEAVVMALTYILAHLGESPLPGFVQKLLKEVSSSTKSEVLLRLGNSISWSQANFTEVSNGQIVPYVVLGAKNGNMAVKVFYIFLWDFKRVIITLENFACVTKADKRQQKPRN